MGLFQGALEILQRIVVEMQKQGGIGSISGKQLSVILNQVKTLQKGEKKQRTVLIINVRGI